ncbi:MAG: helix-turn-helix domain-containing protein [Ignavibacteriales bacterium]
MSYKKLGKRIQLAREDAGLNQEQLAKMLGCSQPTLSNYEKGKSRVYLAQLQKMAELLNKPASYFLEAMEPAENESESTLPAAISLVADTMVVNAENDILEILRLLMVLPQESRKIVYEFALWQQSRLGRN